jgi:FMN phosphatase YigB (HAD superfamily)
MPATHLPVVFFDIGETLVTQAGGSQRAIWVPGAQTTLDQLKARGARLGLISNTPGLTREEVLQRLPTDFDLGVFEPALVILSSETTPSVSKPDLAIFRLAADAAGVDPGGCLFCGDSLLETLAAQKSGMHAARLQLGAARELEHLVETIERLASLQ